MKTENKIEYKLVVVEEPQSVVVCTLCGAVVNNTRLHNVFHESLVARGIK